MLFESLFLLFSCWLVFFVCFLVNILVSSGPFSPLTNPQFPSVADQVCRLGVAEQLSGFKHRAFTAVHMALCALALVGSPHICVQLWAVISASSLTFGFSWFRMTSTGTLGLCHMASQPCRLVWLFTWGKWDSKRENRNLQSLLRFGTSILSSLLLHFIG